MAQNSKKQGKPQPTAKNAPKTRKKPISDLKAAAKALGKIKIDTELVKKTIPYWFETDKNELHDISDIVTRVRLGALYETYLLNYEQFKPIDFGLFSDLFVKWTELQAVAEIAKDFGLLLVEFRAANAFCINQLCRVMYDYKIENNLPPIPFRKTKREILAEYERKLNIKFRRPAPARLPQSIKQGFAALGIEPPKADFCRFPDLQTKFKTFILLERCKRRLLLEPQTPKIKELMAEIEQKQSELARK